MVFAARLQEECFFAEKSGRKSRKVIWELGLELNGKRMGLGLASICCCLFGVDCFLS